ncbi:hypothetical protein [Polaribacter porphyrae]|uniref:Uncharacterized protein n=1 Tax=Polaribacter porphyrae TaxID=1137780 RepID=A0A2S7WJR1_9FLAO|nr:hypothetical protein [Polaribacter porphyrae]PQJ77834.1 hypothetical protein BTO18_00930 [Polaribacter porphyrae]
MKTNNIDKNIKQKLENRTFTPSASAWERLSVQLDEQSVEKKKGWFFYIGIAASILFLVSIGIQFFSSETEVVKPKEELVITPTNKKEIDKKIDKLINEIPIQEAIVKKNEVEVKKEIIHTPVTAKKNIIVNKKSENKNFTNKKIIAKTDTPKKINKDETSTEKIKVNILKQDPNSVIKVNADDLLFAVTHSPKEVKAYYAKYNVNREDVLKTIKSELKKSNIRINPNTILAEVERSIDDEDFQNNFMKSLKRKVSDIASAIASRND